MLDSFGRNIDYMRLSITDRCNMRCKFCMPDGHESLSHEEILRYEEILRICTLASKLGITKFKVTGGEPLVRKGCASFIRALKEEVDGSCVTLTTNGLLLQENLDALRAAKIDGITVSLMSLQKDMYQSITGTSGEKLQDVLEAICQSVKSGIHTKVNTVLLEETQEEITNLIALSEDLPLDVRFIEQMPIGHGKDGRFISAKDALRKIRIKYPDLMETDYKGNGPARYYTSKDLMGKVGIIDAVSEKFCTTCNRVRLTSTGFLKPCLCFDSGTDLRSLLRSEASDDEILEVMKKQIYLKPEGHCFENENAVTEKKMMSQIGG